MGRFAYGGLVGIVTGLFGVPAALAAPPVSIDTGSTAWMLISTGLVLLMIPGWPCFTAVWCGPKTCWAP